MIEMIMQNVNSTAYTAGILALNTANSIVRALVEKGVLSLDDAADIYRKISADTKSDTQGMHAQTVAPTFTGWLDQVADSVDAHKADVGTLTPAKPDLKIVVDNERSEDD